MCTARSEKSKKKNDKERGDGVRGFLPDASFSHFLFIDKPNVLKREKERGGRTPNYPKKGKKTSIDGSKEEAGKVGQLGIQNRECFSPSSHQGKTIVPFYFLPPSNERYIARMLLFGVAFIGRRVF